MKDLLTGKKNNQAGFSTLEILIAMTILVLSLTAVVLVLFGGKTVTTDAQTNQEAIYMAQKQLESERAKSRGTLEEFNSILSTIATASGDIYTKQLVVNDISPCSKEINSNIDWDQEQRPQNINLSTIVTSIKAFVATGENCNGTPPKDPWEHPDTLGTEDLMPAGIVATGVDVVNKIVFLSTKHAAVASSDFYIIDATDGTDPVTIQSLNTGPGLNDIYVVKNLKNSGKDFAFGANDSATGQLQAIDITDILAPTLIASASLPGIDPAGSYPEGNCIFYYDSKIYIGTKETAGPEFHVFDFDPNTLTLTHLGSRELTHNVNEVMVSGNYAYLATSDNSGELMILDISDPANILHPDVTGTKFNAAGNEDATTVFVLGNKTYLGRKYSSTNPELYILDTFNPSSIIQLGNKNVVINPASEQIEDLVVVGHLLFLGSGDSNEEFQVWRISNPANPELVSTFNFPAKITALDFENNLIYASAESNDALRIIYDNP